MQVYGLRAAKHLIRSERKEIASAFPRSRDPFIKGQVRALVLLEEKIDAEITRIMATLEPEALR